MYLFSPSDGSQTLLDRGHPGTSLFALSETTTFVRAGIATWDGAILDLNLSNITNQDTGELRFQLLNHDGDTGSAVTVKLLSNDIDQNETPAVPPAGLALASPPGSSIKVEELPGISTPDLTIDNIRFERLSGLYSADLRLRNTAGNPWNKAVVAFPDLPSGLTLSNASGTSDDGVPYVNLSSVLPSGGLPTNALSERVLLQFQVAPGARVQLSPVVFAASQVDPPSIEFQPVGPLTVMPGRRLEVSLTATDPEGDLLTFWLDTLRTGAQLPNGWLEGNGKLIFVPEPDQLGTYEFDLVVSDTNVSGFVVTPNLHDVRQTVRLHVVPDSVTTTRIAGFVKDTNDQPLAGVPVEVADVQTTTQTDGSFVLDFGTAPLPAGNLKVQGNVIAGNFINTTENVLVLLGHDVYAGVQNDLARPIYLAKIDVANAVQIDPSQDTLVTSAAIPNASLLVRAGTLRNAQGNPFTGMLALTEVPANRTTSDYPDEFSAATVFRIDATDGSELQFTQPAPLTLPNRERYPSPSSVAINGKDPLSGKPFFEDLGTANGDKIEPNAITGDGVQSTGEKFTVHHRLDTPTANNPKNKYDACHECGKESAHGRSEIELHSGAYLEMHALVPYYSLGQPRGWTLTYDSVRADPRPIVHVGYSSVGSRSLYSADPNSVRLLAKVSVADGGFAYQAPGHPGGEFLLTGGENAWTVFSPLDASVQLDLRGQPTGVYDRTTLVGIRHLAPTGYVGRNSIQTGRLLHVNSINSAFGSGWGLGGLQQLVEGSDGSALLIDGDGSELLFDPAPTPGAPFISPPGDFTTLQKLGDNTYRRTWTDQSSDAFDAAGRLINMTDRNGNATRFAYDAAGNLTRITDPVGLETLFAYTGGKVTSITDPASRVSQFEYDGAGNLVRITDPDGSMRSFSYDRLHHLTGETDKRLNQDTIGYGISGRATAETMPSFAGGLNQLLVGSTVEVQGLLPFVSGATRDPVNAPSPDSGSSTLPTAQWSGVGYAQNFVLDAAGQRVSGTDAVGLLPTVRRDDQNLVTQSLDGRGHVTYYTYDGRGNLLSSRDELDSVGTALEFNGTSDIVRTGATATLNNLPLTVEAWVKPVDNGDAFLNTNPNVIGNGTNYGNGFGVDARRTGVATQPFAAFINVNTQGGGFRQITLGSIAPDQWRHVAVVYTPGNAKTYLDGQLVDDYSFTQGGPSLVDEIVLGRQGSFFKGGLDELRVWNVARTAAEIQADISRQLSGTEPELVHYFQLDEGMGTTVADATGSGLTGTITGALFATGAPIGAGMQFTYDTAFSQLTSMIDQLGHQTLFGIDPANGNTLSINRVVGAVGGPDDIVTQFAYLANGLVDTVTDPLGRVTDYDYDALGRMTMVTFAVGTSDEAMRLYEYDAAGNLTALIDENGHRTEYEYDALVRLTRIIEADPDGASPLLSPVTVFAYDAAGNLTNSTDSRNNNTTYEYNSPDAMIRMIDANNQSMTYTYTVFGNVASMTDKLGHVTRYEYDLRNRLTKTIDPDLGETQFEYDLDNNVTAVIDPVGNRTEFEYDARSRRVRETDPLAKMTDYVYDGANNLASMTDRLGRVTNYAYDDLDRRTTETWAGGGNTINFTYDAASNLLTATDGFSALSFAYDNRNRQITVDNQGTPNVPRVVLDYTYDAVGNRLTMADTIAGVAGGTNTYTYDALDRLTRLTQSGANVSDKRVDITYNPLGQFANIARFSDLAGTQLVVSSNYAHDALNRLTGLHHQNAAASDVAFFDFSYDTHSRITQIVDVDGTTTYSYDDRDQLTGADHSDASNPDETYTYDANGNRLTSSRHGNGYVTGPNNRLLSDGTFNYAYDDEGNLILRTNIADGSKRTFQWDHRNRLTAVIDKTTAEVETQRVAFTYDAFDRRLSKAVDATPLDAVDAIFAQFVYDGQDVLMDFLDADGSGPTAPTLTQRYLHGPAVDQVLAQDNGAGNVFWHLSDHLGTVRDLVDNSSSVANHLTYDSYGSVIAETNPDNDRRYRFTGREFDVETGLGYYRARYYNLDVGVFIGEDPINFAGRDANLYRYVGNNSINNTDATGTEKVSIGFFGGPLGSGHAALSVSNAPYIGLYPPSGNVDLGQILSGQTFDKGVVKEEPEAPAWHIDIDITPGEARVLKDYLAEAMRNPPPYNGGQLNCVAFVKKALDLIGVSAAGNTATGLAVGLLAALPIISAERFAVGPKQ